MNTEQYIKSRFEKILSETIGERTESILNKLNYDEEVPFSKPGKPFDYVQEGNDEVCEQCGSEMNEGECMECGYKNETEIMELGGMDSDHPKFGKLNLKKMSKSELEDLLDDKDDSEDDEWEEIDIDTETDWDKLEEEEDEIMEKLHGGQKKLDVAKPYGKLTKDDFKKLRSMKEEDVEEPLYEVEFSLNEYTMGDDDLETVKGYGDFSTDSPNIKPGKNQVKNVGDKYQRKISKKFDDYELEESETEEGNAFTGALSKAKKEGKDSFEVDGKKYDVKESEKEMNEKWKGDVKVKQTGEYSDMTIEEINSEIKKLKSKNDKAKEAGKKVPQADRTKMSQLYFAKRAKQDWKGKGKAKVTESLIFTEREIISLIEHMVNEEKKFRMSEPKGYQEYEKAHKADKKENEDYLKSVAKKMTDYLKGASDKESKYEMKETQKFPTENGGKRKKYTPSEAVDEYIDAFSYPGQTNLVYDEIKPNDEWIEANLVGSSKTGNAQVDKDGKALGNVVPSEVGEKFLKNFKDNLYGQEQQDASYKRQPQPVDQAGEETERGSLKSKRGKKTSQGVLNKLEESIDEKQSLKLNEEFGRMQQLMGYKQKTQ